MLPTPLATEGSSAGGDLGSGGDASARVDVGSSGDTIAAIATAPGLGGIGVVRISGPRALAIGIAITGKSLVPRRAMLASFLDKAGARLDEGIVLAFPAPRSYTGEDTVELQGHGGPVVLRLVLASVLALGARLARPGEFTERAFLNGKLDLAQAEAVADLIASGSEAAARGAMRSLQGAFSSAIHAIDESVLGLRVFVEAALDFPDEDIEFLAAGQVADRLAAVAREIDQLVARTRQGILLRDGIVIALVGAPNVGKSSLLNRLSGQDRAIVSDMPGTTRDALEVDLSLDGLPVRIVDTAGLRESDDPVEQEGMRRTRLQAAQADIVLALEDDRDADDWDGAAVRQLLQAHLPDLDPRRVVRVRNKIDLSGREQGIAGAEGAAVADHDAEAETDQVPLTVRVSARTGAGIPALVSRIESMAGFAADGSTFTARERHIEALHDAAGAIARARELLAAAAPPEVVAEELREAHLAFGRIVGGVSADELLGEIFSRFCIGK